MNVKIESNCIRKITLYLPVVWFIYKLPTHDLETDSYVDVYVCFRLHTSHQTKKNCKIITKKKKNIMSSLLWNYFDETPCPWKGVTCAEAQNTYPRAASWFNSCPSGHDWTPPKTNPFQQFSQWVTSFFALQRNPSRTTNFPEKSHQILPRKFKVILLLILCGEPTKNPCPIPSSPSSSPPNISAQPLLLLLL